MKQLAILNKIAADTMNSSIRPKALSKSKPRSLATASKTRIIAGLALCVVLCIISLCASVAWGARSVSFDFVLAHFGLLGSTQDFADAQTFSNIIDARIPRTFFGFLAGASLGVAGALMQAITRNPIADPSILGVNTGASLFVVIGIAYFHIQSGMSYLLLAFVGASITALAVYGLASIGQGGASPMKLALAGAAASTALQALVNAIMLPNSQVMDQFRFWQVGSTGGASWEDIHTLLTCLLIGLALAFWLAQGLNTLALGDEMAASLGLKVQRCRALAALAAILLCASCTALAGPIAFVGLMVPHAMRIIFGPNMKLLLPFSALSGASLLLIADVIGRLSGGPSELEVGIVTALMGAPVFIAIVRKLRLRSL